MSSTPASRLLKQNLAWSYVQPEQGSGLQATGWTEDPLHPVMWSIDIGLKGDRKDSQEHLDGKIWWHEVSSGLELKDFRLSHFPDRAGEQPSYLYSPGVFKSCPTVAVQFSTRAGGREPEPLTPAGAALTSPRLLELHSGHEVVTSEQTAYQAGPTAPQTRDVVELTGILHRQSCA